MGLICLMASGGAGIIIGIIYGYVKGEEDGRAKGKKEATKIMRDLKKEEKI